MEKKGADLYIHLKGARTHNLQNIDLNIPRGKITALVGVCGAGKTSLAFDTLYAEGYSRYIESISPYIRQFLDKMPPADVDEITGLLPSIGVRQKRTNKNPRSTVATAADIYDYFRLIFARAADFYCPKCRQLVKIHTVDEIIELLLKKAGREIDICFQYNGEISFLINRGYYYHILEGRKLRLNGSVRNKPVFVLADQVKADQNNRSRIFEAVDRAISLGDKQVTVFDSSVQIDYPVKYFCPHCNIDFQLPDENLFAFNSPRGACPVCRGSGSTRYRPCSACQGSRLNPEALGYRFQKKNIAQVSAMTIGEARDFFSAVNTEDYRSSISPDVFTEITTRLNYLFNCGLGYLPLNRLTYTLSKGEYHRINLAFVLGSTLADSLLILDQPSADLNPSEYARTADFLHKLKQNGNTLLVIEHNPDLIKMADWVIELGPGAGKNGGKVVFNGEISDYLSLPFNKGARAFFENLNLAHPPQPHRWLEYSNLYSRNLKIRSCCFPAEMFSLVCGVSGAGKTTLLAEELLRKQQLPEGIKKVVFVDPAQHSVSHKITLASMFKLMTPIRELFARQLVSRNLRLTAGHFSRNSVKGRCPACKGRGFEEKEMQFLPSVRIPCEECGSTGFQNEVLKVRVAKKNISQWLNTPIEQASGYLEDLLPGVSAQLQALSEAGLGYLELGRRLSTLSSGELQRLRLQQILNAGETDTLFLLDEPSCGLHPVDLQQILGQITRILKLHNTVIAADHSRFLFSQCHYIMELGPGGGRDGGQLLFQGKPKDYIKNASTFTAVHLKKIFPS